MIIKTRNNKMVYTKPCSHPLSCIPTHFHSFPSFIHQLLIIYNTLLLISSFFPPTHTQVQLTPTHFKSTPNHLQTLLPISSPYPNSTPNPTHHLPLQPIFGPCIYLPTCVLYLCAYVPLCFPRRDVHFKLQKKKKPMAA